jgi:hypothetical protein
LLLYLLKFTGNASEKGIGSGRGRGKTSDDENRKSDGKIKNYQNQESAEV